MAKDLTKGKPLQTIVYFSLPIIGGNLFQLFYTLADTVIVGQFLGTDALAAVGSTSMVVYLILCFIQGITGGFGICLGHHWGQQDAPGMRRSIAFSTLFSILTGVTLTLVSCLLCRQFLVWLHTPQDIRALAYDYLFVILLGTGATVFYNMISNILRALGDSKTPLIYLVFSSILNIILDLVFLLPLHMGIAGAAWATVLSQLIAALLSTWSGIRKFSLLRLTRADFVLPRGTAREHLRIGFPMAFQMSVMNIGQLAMQSSVNALGAGAIAGYTAATKVDQISVLINGAIGVAISSYVAQNYGAQKKDRIQEGVKDCMLLACGINAVICVLILTCRQWVVPLFVSDPTPELYTYANQYFLAVAPFYLLLGTLSTYRSAIQSMGNSRAPFAACVIELVCRIGATSLLAAQIGYVGICLATPLAWIGANALLLPIYARMIRGTSRYACIWSGQPAE